MGNIRTNTALNKSKLEKSNQTKKTSIDLQDAHYKVTRYGDKSNIAQPNKKQGSEKQKHEGSSA